MPILLALAAAAGWGGSDYAAGVASRRSTSVAVVIFVHLVAVLTLGSMLLGTRDIPDDVGDLALGVAGGVSGGIGAVLLYRGLAIGKMSVVAPVTALGAACVPVVFGAAVGDAVSPTRLVGIALALGAIGLVSTTSTAEASNALLARTEAPAESWWEHDDYWERLEWRGTRMLRMARRTIAPVRPELEVLCRTERPAVGWWERDDYWERLDWRGARTLKEPGMPEALLSGIGFGGFFLFIGYTSANAGLWPILSARSASVLLFGIFSALTLTSPLPHRSSWRAAILAGILDAGAAVAFLAATRSELLAVVAVLSSLYPAVTVLLARVVDQERVSHLQLLGLFVALAAVALIATG